MVASTPSTTPHLPWPCRRFALHVLIRARPPGFADRSDKPPPQSSPYPLDTSPAFLQNTRFHPRALRGPVAKTGIKEVRHPHDAVMDYLLANPFWTLRELSMATGYSVSWLSQIIRSDCFQDEYARRRGDVECNVLGTIQERLGSLAHLAIDRMEEVLVETTDKDLIVDAFDKVLHRTGYAPKATPVAPVVQQQNNLILVEKGELAELRGMITGQAPVAVLPPPENDE